MTVREMDKLTYHLDKYFEQEDAMVLHPVTDSGYHIDVLLYRPSEKYPFWKLVTMGASDYKMPKCNNTIADRNEYIMFVDKDVDLEDKEIISWYREKLLTVACFAYENKVHITYGHSFEWENEDPDEEMVAAFIEFPQIIENTGILRCKLNPFKMAACLQVVLLNKGELSKLMAEGPQAFSEFLYPEDGGKGHFLSEKQRSNKF